MGPIVHCHSVGGMESEAQYAPRNAEIQPGPDYANTSTNMGGRDSKEPEQGGESSAHSVEEGSPRQRARRTTRKKSPISRMKRRGRRKEREGGGKSSPSAFPHSQLSRRRRGRRHCRSLSRSLEDHSQVFPAFLSPSSLSRRRKTVQVTLSLLHPTCEKWPKIRV